MGATILDSYGRPVQTEKPKRQHQMSVRPVSRKDTAPDDKGKDKASPVSRWEAAETTRLNSERWSKAHGLSINADIQNHLSTLRNRTAYEAANNPIIEGMINTHVADVVGDEGPTLRVNSGDPELDTTIETIWANWWEKPDIAGRLSGVDILNLCVRSLWHPGEFLIQLTNGGDDRGATLRLLMIDPRRLSESVKTGNDTFMGIRFDDNGTPLEYFIEQPIKGYVEIYEAFTGTNAEPIDAADIIHGFMPLEVGQARGVPLLASVLQVVADLRDFDVQVLDAARAAADYAIVMATTDPNADPEEIDPATSYEIERRQITYATPGWAPHQMQPNQPATTYTEFRRERLRDLGLPVGMPLMKVMRDASNHNYSSARMDDQGYNRGNRRTQAWLARTALNRFLRALINEARLMPDSGIAELPDQLKWNWIWPQPPHVDPAKEASGEATRIATGTLSYTRTLAAQGIDVDDHISELLAERKKFEDAGLDYPGDKLATAQGQPVDEDEGDEPADKDSDDAQDK